MAGACGARQATIRIGAIVEPLRDELIELIVSPAHIIGAIAYISGSLSWCWTAPARGLATMPRC
jgi:hypothetical protein